MTINIRDNLTLPGDLVASGHALDKKPASKQTDGIFAGQLDRVLDTGRQASLSTPSKAQALAETLSLQMLHSTLSLAGETLGEASPTAMPYNLPSQNLKALANAYGISQPGDLAQKAHTEVQPSQLQEIDIPPAAPAAPAVETTGSHWLDPVIARASSRYGVDVGLIKAVIKAESNFNPHAVSHAGARGLMQLMPGTARSLGVNDSFDPEQNVMAGTRFLSDLLKRYNGDLDSALAAYNWGPGNVDKKPGRLPRETRDYLARVKQLYDSYTA
jgi:soluble lytic murein transglycosylase-like protein